MKTIKTIIDVIVYMITGSGDIAAEMVSAGVLDYSGQGRNQYGK